MNRRLISLTAALALLGAAPAYAQDSARDAYGEGGAILQELEAAPAAPERAPAVRGASQDERTPAAERARAADRPAAARSLPFTGLDLSLIAAVGVALLGLGLVMRRASAAVSPA